MTDTEGPTMDAGRNPRTISDDAPRAAGGDRPGGSAGQSRWLDDSASKVRTLLKRVALAVVVVALVAVLGVTAWLAPLVFDRDYPQPVADPAPLEPTGHVDVGGAQLPYVEQGTGPPVLLIHAGGSGLREFDAVADALAADHRVITYSRRGYEGAGAPVTAGDPLPHVDAAAVLEDLDAEGAIVTGYSGSAGIATRLALERPDLVAGLVLLDPALDDVPLGFLRVVLAQQVRGWFMSEERAMVPFFRWVYTHDDGYSPWDDDPAVTDEVKHRLLSGARAMAGDFELLEAAGLGLFPREGLAELEVPVTLVVGERSRSHYHRMADTLEEDSPGAQRIEVPGAGHGMTFENPRGTADAIRQAAQAALDDAQASAEASHATVRRK